MYGAYRADIDKLRALYPSNPGTSYELFGVNSFCIWKVVCLGSTSEERMSEIEGASHILVPRKYHGTVTADWFSPDFWGGKARPVAVGGRGGAWFIDTPIGDAVLRQYRRGGLMARVSESSYWFSGYDRTRAFAEFRLLQALRNLDLPVPEPLAALVVRSGLMHYKAWILVRRIPGALPLPEVSNLDDPGLWRQIGAMIRRFHDAGLNHTDLNCDNILVSSEGTYLIDFDKCRMVPNDGSAAWKAGNIERLKRSVQKRCVNLGQAEGAQLWSALLDSYQR